MQDAILECSYATVKTSKYEFLEANHFNQMWSSLRTSNIASNHAHQKIPLPVAKNTCRYVENIAHPQGREYPERYYNQLTGNHPAIKALKHRGCLNTILRSQCVFSVYGGDRL
jgi:hypothetical protein